jgi:hypothetical protein
MRRQIHRRNTPYNLGWQCKWFSSGREYGGQRTAFGNGFYETSDAFDHSFTVIEYEEQIAILQSLRQPIGPDRANRRYGAECGTDGRHHRTLIIRVAEISPPHPIGAGADMSRGDLFSEPGLA